MKLGQTNLMDKKKKHIKITTKLPTKIIENIVNIQHIASPVIK